MLLICLDPKQRSLYEWGQTREDLGLVVEGLDVYTGGSNLLSRFDHIAAGFDLVIIDPPGTLGEHPVNAMLRADLLLLPVSPAPIEVRAIEHTFKFVRKTREEHKLDELDQAILILRKDPRTTSARTIRSRVDHVPDFPILDTELDLAEDYSACYDAGVGVTLFDPSSAAAGQVGQLCDELAKRLGLPTKRAPARPRKAAPKAAGKAAKAVSTHG